MSKLTNVETIASACGAGPCPGAHRADEGLVIVGRPLSAEEAETLDGRIGENEVAVFLPHNLLDVKPHKP